MSTARPGSGHGHDERDDHDKAGYATGPPRRSISPATVTVVRCRGGDRRQRQRQHPVRAGPRRRRVPPTRPHRPATRPSRVLAGKGCSSRANRAHLRRRGIWATISERRNQQANQARRGSDGGRPPAVDKIAYKCATRSSADSTGSSSAGPSLKRVDDLPELSDMRAWRAARRIEFRLRWSRGHVARCLLRHACISTWRNGDMPPRRWPRPQPGGARTIAPARRLINAEHAPAPS
jgi:hypothetical protein